MSYVIIINLNSKIDIGDKTNPKLGRPKFEKKNCYYILMDLGPSFGKGRVIKSSGPSLLVPNHIKF